MHGFLRTYSSPCHTSAKSTRKTCLDLVDDEQSTDNTDPDGDWNNWSKKKKKKKLTGTGGPRQNQLKTQEEEDDALIANK